MDNDPPFGMRHDSIGTHGLVPHPRRSPDTATTLELFRSALVNAMGTGVRTDLQPSGIRRSCRSRWLTVDLETFRESARSTFSIQASSASGRPDESDIPWMSSQKVDKRRLCEIALD